MTESTTCSTGKENTCGPSDCALKCSMIFLFISAIEWLLISGIFAVLGSIKMHAPDFIANCESLTYGRVVAIQHAAFIYGWACNAAFAVGIWIMYRLNKSGLCSAWVIGVAGKFWNITVFIGIRGILFGHMSGVEGLPMPAFVSPALFAISAFIGIAVFLAYLKRDKEDSYISQWYIVGAFVWLPILLAAAQIMLFFAPTQGVVQYITEWWFAASFYGLWLAPIALGAAYYIIPQILGVRVCSYGLSKLAFWLWVLLVGFADMSKLVGSPVPVWVQSVGVVASIGLLFPALLIGINLFITTYRDMDETIASPSLRFIYFGLLAFTVSVAFNAFCALPQFSEVLRFTHVETSIEQLTLLGFFSMTMMGSIYYIMPKLLDREWPCLCLIRAHFWCTVTGLSIIFMTLLVAGWQQGYNINDPANDFVFISNASVQLLRYCTGGTFIFLLGQFAFMFHFFKMLVGSDAETASDGPTVFPTPEHEIEG